MRRHAVAGAAQPRRDGDVEMVAKTLGMVGSAAAQRDAAPRLPVQACGEPLAVDGDHLAGFDPADPGEEAPRSIFGHQREKFGRPDLVGSIIHGRKGMETLGHRGEGDKALCAMIMERPVADRVAGQIEAAGGRIPQREGVITDQVDERFAFPPLPGAHQQGGVAHRRCLAGLQAKLRSEIFAIVEPQVGDEDKTAAAALLRPAIPDILRKTAVEATRMA